MSVPTRRRVGAVVALLGVTAFGTAVAWFGMAKPHGSASPAPSPASPPAAARPDGADSSPQAKAAEEAGQVPRPVAPARAETAQGPAEPPQAPASPTVLASGQAPPPEPVKASPAVEAAKTVGPSFDIVRIEPNGEAVIAGRGAPGATIELLRNGRSHARALADASGLFAFVPPPLAPGSHEIGLTSIAPDGTRAQSRESVTVVISDDRARKPLVTLASPDRPTVVLSAPDAPERKPLPAEAAGAEGGGAAVASAPVPATQPTPSTPPGKPQAAVRPNVKILSVEAEEGGRLYVSGDAAAGATVRLYLNDSFIAPGGTGSDGKVSFAIKSGVRPGDYRVRLDDVDPVSGDVRSRAEVAFNVPAPLTVPLPPQAEPLSPEAPLGRAVAGSEEPAPSGRAPLISAMPPEDSIAPAQQADRGSSPSTAAASAGRPGSHIAESAAEAGPGPLGMARGTEPGTVVVPHVATAIVSRGDNLWRISRRIYGEGTRYTVIYDANQAQIRNPDRIYPGQIFVLPSAEAPAEPSRAER
jgi:hypothetical protein